MIQRADIETQEIERLFKIAIKLSTEESEAFLERECQGRETISSEVRELLQSSLATGPLDYPPEIPLGFTRLAGVVAPRMPERIGAYKINQIIASGGMGTVYEARQQQPNRTVALKVMRWEISSRKALQRFHYESELLAKLHHPGIAQVYDAGIHDEAGLRLPYFAMELVEGAKPLTEYARDRDLNLREKLNLFAQVCDAVEYGHQRGVVHRDLKPSNIVIGEDGRPRLIDFGVARCTASDLTLTSLQTETGQLLGTLQYMSPEQCLGKNEEIDTRSDVYMLAVVLFELLSNDLPYDVRGLSIYEGTQVVIHGKPKTLSSIDDSLRGEMEIIALKAMEKDRDRRYGMAGELAADIRRYLAGEAILAKRPSISYQLKVFGRRNKTLAAATACVLAALAAGLVSTSAALVKTNQALRSSRFLSHELSNALSVAMSTIVSVDPTAAEIEYGDELTTEELVDRVAKLVEGELEFTEKPLDEAELRLKLGRAYRHMGRYTDAKTHLEGAMKIWSNVYGIHPKVAECRLGLDDVYTRLGLPMAHGNGTSQVVAWHDAGLLPICKTVGIAYLRQGWGLKEQGNYEASLIAHNRAIEILQQAGHAESKHIAWAINNRGVVYGDMQEYEKADAEFKLALDMRIRVLGPDHSHTVHTYLNLAHTAMLRNALDEALPWAEKGWDAVNRLEVIDKDHAYFKEALEVYSAALFALREYEKAVPILRAHMQYCARNECSPRRSRWQLGMCLLHLGKFDESEKLLLKSYENDVKRGKILHKPWVAWKACERLVLLYETWDRPRIAEMWRETLAEIEAIVDPNNDVAS